MARASRRRAALMLLRQLLAVAVLPFTVTVLIPLWIGVAWQAPSTAAEFALVMTGLAIGLGGLGLFAWCLALFWTRGRGTLAPWDPPRQFVAEGPYRHVRNPMISGVLLILVGEWAVFRSVPVGQWAGLFALINAIYIPWTEEPLLEARFGDTYREYCRAVPRFLPRLRPWQRRGG